MDPNELVLDANVRSMEDIEETEAFKELYVSIETARKVLKPVEYYLDRQGRKVVLDGFLRVKCARMLDLKDIPAVRIPAPKSPQDRVIHQLTSGVVYATLPDLDIAWALSDLKERTEMSNAELGALFGKGDSWVSHHLGLLRLIPELQKQVPRMGYRAAYEASTLPEDDQAKWVDSIAQAKTNREVRRLKKTIAHANAMENPIPVQIETRAEGDELVMEPAPNEDLLACQNLLRMALANVGAARRRAEEAGIDIGEELKRFIEEVS